MPVEQLRKGIVAAVAIVTAATVGGLGITSAASALEETSTGSITVSNLADSGESVDVTAKAYKIIDVNYDYDTDQPETPEFTWNFAITGWVKSNFPEYIGADNSVTGNMKVCRMSKAKPPPASPTTRPPAKSPSSSTSWAPAASWPPLPEARRTRATASPSTVLPSAATTSRSPTTATSPQPPTVCTCIVRLTRTCSRSTSTSSGSWTTRPSSPSVPSRAWISPSTNSAPAARSTPVSTSATKVPTPHTSARTSSSTCAPTCPPTRPMPSASRIGSPMRWMRR